MDGIERVEHASPARDEATADAGCERTASRISGDYLLRSLQLLKNLSWGDLMGGLVTLAIIQSNVGHLDRGAGPGGDYADLDSVPPDAVRRPVSVLSLSATLGLPYETTRRHVAKLMKAGICVRVKGGVVVPSRVLDSDAHREQLRRNLANLRRLFRNLRAAGVEFE